MPIDPADGRLYIRKEEKPENRKNPVITLMAISVAVPKDLSGIKTKVAMNLTKRQLICFGAQRQWAYRFTL